MATRERIIKHDKIELNIQLAHYLEKIASYLPSIFKAPAEIFALTLKLSNFVLQFTLFALLIGQTAHVLNNSEKRYINLRHLLIKWVTLVLILLMADQIKQHTTYAQLFSLLCNVFALLMIYPSKFIKNLHLKYFSFSEKKKYDDSEDDPTNYEMTLTTRMLVSLTIFFLNSSRFMITFVPLHHRKRIEEAMKGVNMVIVEEKYFWKIYESAWANPQQQSTENSSTMSNNLKNSMLIPKNNSSKEGLKSSTLSKPALKENMLRVKASEQIEYTINSIGGGSNRKFTEFRKIDLVYNIESSELSMIGLEDGKTFEHILVEIAKIEGQQSILQLICEEEDDPIYVKFNVKKDLELFVNSISIDE